MQSGGEEMTVPQVSAGHSSHKGSALTLECAHRGTKSLSTAFHNNAHKSEHQNFDFTSSKRKAADSILHCSNITTDKIFEIAQFKPCGMKELVSKFFGNSTSSEMPIHITSSSCTAMTSSNKSTTNFHSDSSSFSKNKSLVSGFEPEKHFLQPSNILSGASKPERYPTKPLSFQSINASTALSSGFELGNSSGNSVSNVDFIPLDNKLVFMANTGQSHSKPVATSSLSKSSSAATGSTEILPFKSCVKLSSTQVLPVNRVAPLQSFPSSNCSEPSTVQEQHIAIKSLPKASTFTSLLTSLPAIPHKLTNVEAVKPASFSFQETDCIISDNIVEKSNPHTSKDHLSNARSSFVQSLPSKLQNKMKYRGVVLVGDERLSHISWPEELPMGRAPLYILARHGTSLQTLSTLLSGPILGYLASAPGKHNWQQLLIVCTLGWRDLLQVSEDEEEGRRTVSLRYPQAEFVSSVVREVASAQVRLKALVPSDKASVIFANAWPVNIQDLDEFLNWKSSGVLCKKQPDDMQQLSMFLEAALFQINNQLNDASLCVGPLLSSDQQKCLNFQWRLTFSGDNLINGIIPSKGDVKEIHSMLLRLYHRYTRKITCPTPYCELYIIGDSRLSAVAGRWPSTAAVAPVFVLSDDITADNVRDVIRCYCRSSDAVIFVPSSEKWVLEDVRCSECSGHPAMRVPSLQKELPKVDRLVSILMQVHEHARLENHHLILSPLLPLDLVEKVKSAVRDHIAEYEHWPDQRVRDGAVAQQAQLVKYLNKLARRLKEACVFANAMYTDAFYSMLSDLKCEHWGEDIVSAVINTLEMYNLTHSESELRAGPRSHDRKCNTIPVKIIDTSLRLLNNVWHQNTSEVRFISKKRSKIHGETFSIEADRHKRRSNNRDLAHTEQMHPVDNTESIATHAARNDVAPQVLDYAEELLQYKAESSSLRKRLAAMADDGKAELAASSRTARSPSGSQRWRLPRPSESPEGALSSPRTYRSRSTKVEVFRDEPDSRNDTIRCRKRSLSSCEETCEQFDKRTKKKKRLRRFSHQCSKSRLSASPTHSPTSARCQLLNSQLEYSSDSRSPSHRTSSRRSSHRTSSRRSSHRTSSRRSSHRTSSRRSSHRTSSRRSSHRTSSRRSSHRTSSRRSSHRTSSRRSSHRTSSDRFSQRSSSQVRLRRSQSRTSSGPPDALPRAPSDSSAVDGRNRSRNPKQGRSRSSSCSSSSSSALYRTSRRKIRQEKKTKKKKQKIQSSERAQKSESYKMSKLTSCSVEELQEAYRRGLQSFLSRQCTHPLHHVQLAAFLASSEVKRLMEAGVPPEHISERWQKISAQKVHDIESGTQQTAATSPKYKESPSPNSKSKESPASPDEGSSTGEVISSENVDEVGEDLDIDGLVTNEAQNERSKRFEDCSTKLIVRSVLELVSLFEETIGVLASALPLLLTKCTEMEKSGLNPLTAFGHEEASVLSLMLAKIEANTGGSSPPRREEVIRQACVRELSRLLAAIERHRSLDLTSLAIQTLHMDRLDAMQHVAEQLRRAASSESAASVYSLVSEEQSVMRAFVHDNNRAFQTN